MHFLSLLSAEWLRAFWVTPPPRTVPPTVEFVCEERRVNATVQMFSTFKAPELPFFFLFPADNCNGPLVSALPHSSFRGSSQSSVAYAAHNAKLNRRDGEYSVPAQVITVTFISFFFFFLKLLSYAPPTGKRDAALFIYPWTEMRNFEFPNMRH